MRALLSEHGAIELSICHVYAHLAACWKREAPGMRMEAWAVACSLQLVGQVATA